MLILVTNIMLCWTIGSEDGTYHLELLRLERYATGSLIGVIKVKNSRGILLFMSFLLVSRGPKMGTFILRS